VAQQLLSATHAMSVNSEKDFDTDGATVRSFQDVPFQSSMNGL
jgi:hypothetical protein